MRAYRVAELFNTGFVPMTISFKGLGKEGCLQKFLSRAVTVQDLIRTKQEEAVKHLSTLPQMTVHMYLLHEMLLGNNDGGINNVMCDGRRIYNIDNEYTFPPYNYWTGMDNEGRGGAKITLLALPQARKPLKRALLLLFSSPLVKKGLKGTLYRMQGTPAFDAMMERVEKLRQLCRFALNYSKFPLTPERVYYELFTHEEFVYYNRLKSVGDLEIFGRICHYFPDKILDISSNIFFQTSVKEGMFRTGKKVGVAELEKVRRFVSCPDGKVLEVMEVNVNETLVKPFLGEDEKRIENEDLPLLLKGTPRIAARRILREFPGFPLWVQIKRGTNLVLCFSLSDETYKQYEKYLPKIRSSRKKYRIKINSRQMDALKKSPMVNVVFPFHHPVSLHSRLSHFPVKNAALIAAWTAAHHKSGIIFYLNRNNLILEVKE